MNERVVMDEKLNDLLTEVVRTREQLKRFIEESKQFSSRETKARNEFNAATKAFDEAVAELRKDAPWNTDWSSSRKGA